MVNFPTIFHNAVVNDEPEILKGIKIPTGIIHKLATSALGICISWGATKLFRALIHEHDQPIDEALNSCLRLNKIEFFKIIMVEKPNEALKIIDEQNLLHKAIRTSRFEIMHLIIENGGAINSRDENHWTPLALAIISAPDNCVRMLIAAGADINSISSDKSILAHSIIFGRNNLINEIIEQTSKLDAVDSKGNSALHIAADFSNFRAIEAIAQKGANLDIQNNAGYSPILCAAKSGCQKSVQALIDSGADINSQNTHTKSSAMHYSILQGLDNVTQTLLLNKEFCTELSDSQMRTPLTLAMELNRLDLIDEIIQRRNGLYNPAATKA